MTPSEDVQLSTLNESLEILKKTKQTEEVKAKIKELEEMRNSLLKAYKAYNENTRELFDTYVEKTKSSPCIPSGFADLDKLLDGGLYSGLYVIGAISSLGKTTFCLQICDQIARSGKDVMIISLEMPRVELVAKSLSRLTHDINLALTNYSSTSWAKTTRGLLNGFRYDSYSKEELDLIEMAKDEYFGKIAPHIFIREGIGNIGVKEIRSMIEGHEAARGHYPIVLIDYLQIMAPPDSGRSMTDKQITDQNIMELKRMSRDYGTTIIGISSLNRDSYNSSISMSSFKESGAIEYSSDTLIGLQYAEMDSTKDDANGKFKANQIRNETSERARQGKPIKIQLKVLKNRNGSKGSVNLQFLPMFNKFERDPGRDILDDEEGMKG